MTCTLKFWVTWTTSVVLPHWYSGDFCSFVNHNTTKQKISDVPPTAELSHRAPSLTNSLAIPTAAYPLRPFTGLRYQTHLPAAKLGLPPDPHAQMWVFCTCCHNEENNNWDHPDGWWSLLSVKLQYFCVLCCIIACTSFKKNQPSYDSFNLFSVSSFPMLTNCGTGLCALP